MIVDDELAFVGGIDSPTSPATACDAAGHPPAAASAGTTSRPSSAGRPWPTWPALHPALGARSTGERARRRRRAGPRRARPGAGRAHRARARLRGAADGEFSILESYARRAAVGRAADLPREPVPVVARDRRDPRGTSCATRRATRSGSLLVLPAKPNSGADDTRGQLGYSPRPTRRRAHARLHALRRPRRGIRARLRARQGRHRGRPLADGRSANLNEHSLFNDTEMNVVTPRPALARADPAAALVGAPRAPAETLGGDPATLIDEIWRPLASEQLERRQAGAPLDPARRRARARVAPLQAPARAAAEPARRRLSSIKRLHIKGSDPFICSSLRSRSSHRVCECAADQHADELALVLLRAVGVLDGAGRLPLPPRRPPRREAPAVGSDSASLGSHRHRADRADGDAGFLDIAVDRAHPHCDGCGGPLAEGQLVVRRCPCLRPSPARARTRAGRPLRAPSRRGRAGTPPAAGREGPPAAPADDDLGARREQERRRVRVRSLGKSLPPRIQQYAPRDCSGPHSSARPHGNLAQTHHTRLTIP